MSRMQVLVHVSAIRFWRQTATSWTLIRRIEVVKAHYHRESSSTMYTKFKVRTCDIIFDDEVHCVPVEVEFLFLSESLIVLDP